MGAQAPMQPMTGGQGARRATTGSAPPSPFALSAMGGMPGGGMVGSVGGQPMQGVTSLQPGGGMQQYGGGGASWGPPKGAAGGGQPMRPADGMTPARPVPGQPDQMYWGGGGPPTRAPFDPSNPGAVDPGFAGMTGQHPGFRDPRQRFTSDPNQFANFLGAQPGGGWGTVVDRGNGTGYASGPAPAGDGMQQYGGGPPGTWSGTGGMTASADGMTGSVGMGGGNPGQPPVLPGNVTTAPPAPGLPPPGGDPFSRPTSAMDVYRSSVPVMQDAMKTAVGGAMGEAGFSGNRFGSYAMDRAAQEGSRAGLQQNQLLTSLLHDQTNRDQDRSLQAAGLGMQHGQAANQMQLDRMRLLGDLGMFEQGRGDLYGRLPYEDFERNKLGFLPMLLQMAQSPGTATSPTWGTQQTGGSPGALDVLSALGPILAAYYGSRG